MTINRLPKPSCGGRFCGCSLACQDPTAGVAIPNNRFSYSGLAIFLENPPPYGRCPSSEESIFLFRNRDFPGVPMPKTRFSYSGLAIFLENPPPYGRCVCSSRSTLHRRPSAASYRRRRFAAGRPLARSDGRAAPEVRADRHVVSST